MNMSRKSQVPHGNLRGTRGVHIVFFLASSFSISISLSLSRARFTVTYAHEILYLTRLFMVMCVLPTSRARERTLARHVHHQRGSILCTQMAGILPPSCPCTLLYLPTLLLPLCEHASSPLLRRVLACGGVRFSWDDLQNIWCVVVVCVLRYVSL